MENTAPLKSKLKAALDELRYRKKVKNQGDFGSQLGYSKSYFSQVMNGAEPLTDKIIDEIETKFGIQKDWFYDKSDDMFLPVGDHLRKKKALGTESEENWPLFVPVAAQAGYAAHVYDPVYMNQLQPYPMLGTPYKGDKFRVFEVEGDSMTIYNEATQEIKGLREGFYIVAQRVEKEDWHQTVQWYVHVIVLQDAVFIKRLYRDIDKDGDASFVLISDNTSYQQRRVKMKDVKELWILKKFISWDVPPPKFFEITV